MRVWVIVGEIFELLLAPVFSGEFGQILNLPFVLSYPIQIELLSDRIVDLSDLADRSPKYC